MELNNSNISEDSNSTASWLASCGFLFPSSTTELSRFNILYGETDPKVSGQEIDPYRIIRTVAENDKNKARTVTLQRSKRQNMLVANVKRKPLPPHIIERFRLNR